MSFFFSAVEKNDALIVLVFIRFRVLFKFSGKKLSISCYIKVNASERASIACISIWYRIKTFNVIHIIS